RGQAARLGQRARQGGGRTGAGGRFHHLLVRLGRLRRLQPDDRRTALRPGRFRRPRAAAAAPTRAVPHRVRDRDAERALRPVTAPSLFVQLRSGPPAAQVYRRTVEIAAHAERLGFRTIWFATRHFGAHHAALPSVFPFVAAAAQHTTTIRLGTGVVALPFEHPVRLAEDAVVTDALSDGRLELGVGKGLGFGHSAASHAVFGVPDGERERLYAERVRELHRILADGWVSAGEPGAPDGESAEAGPTGIALYPPPGTLRARVWQSTGNIAT